MTTPPQPFQRGTVYQAAYIEGVVHPCTARQFARALGVKPISTGVYSGDDIVEALDKRAKRLESLGTAMPRASNAAPGRGLESVSIQSVLETRKRRH